MPGLWTRIRRLLETRVGPAPKQPLPSPRASIAAKRPSLAVPQPEPPRTSVRYERRPVPPRGGAAEWVRRRPIGQQILLALGAISAVAMVAVMLLRVMVEKRLPAAVVGVWDTDAPAYAGRYLELSPRRFGYTTGDSTKPVVWHVISRVRRSDEAGGVLYRIEYREDGTTMEFDVVHYPGPPETIAFAHQRSIGWHRNRSGSSLKPEL